MRRAKRRVEVERGQRLRVDVDPPAASISLTKREREVLSWTSEGRTASEIGEQLNISERTVTFHINNILAKLGAANKVQAVVKAIGMGLIQAP